MSQKKCKKKDYSEPKKPNFKCKNCKRLAKKEKQVCKSKKL